MAVLIGMVLVAGLASCGGGSSGTGTGPLAPVGAAWLGFGSDAQHTGLSDTASQPLNRIVWQTPVDIAPQYNAQGNLLVHYGSPVMTPNNTVIVPVKRSAQDLYRIEAHSVSSGAVLWSVDSDYVMPAHRWTPSYNLTLTQANRIYAPGAGGKVYYRDDADSASAVTHTLAFYGDPIYAGAKAALDASVFINTPITADAQGNIFFGFLAATGNAAGLSSGVARIGADGSGSWAAAAASAADPGITQVAMNSAPALSVDQKTLYIVVSGDPANSGNPKGYLVALDSKTLAPKAHVLLLDPAEGKPAMVSDDSTASPTVAPDGDVFVGVLEATLGAHNERGWLLHFNTGLTQTKAPGSFGWDDTASIVPASMVPGYSGSSSYLLTTKYNNYAGVGSGDGKNKLALLDPNDTQRDDFSAVSVMKEVLTVLGPTEDPGYPGSVYEWCINTAAVDPATRSILINSEDGFLYRWSLASNTLTERVRLTSGLGQSYTPTAIGPDGLVYAINNAVLFAVGR